MKNTDIRSFDLTQRTIFGLLSQTLFGAAYTPEPDVDWTQVYLESENQAVRLQTFANHHLIPGIPDALREDIRRYLAAAMLRDARLHAEHTYVHTLLTRQGIPYSILKGASSACFYPDPLTRVMGDVDFFVGREDFDRALQLFTEEGFSVSGQDHICGAQSSLDILAGIFAPHHDIDLLAVELFHNGSHTAASGADAGTHGIDALHGGTDGHLGPGTGFTGDVAK